MLEKAKAMKYDFIEAVLNIPERKMNPHIVTSFADDYGPGRHNKFASADDAGYGYLYAELCRDHAERKAKVRNRRKADRKAKRKSGAYIKRNGGDFRKDEHYAGDGRMWHDTYNWELSKSQTGGKIRERSLRSDWDMEIEEIIEDLDWAFFDMEYLNEQIGMLVHNLHVGDNYVRFNRLCERRNVVAEVIRKNRFVEEMVKGECY